MSDPQQTPEGKAYDSNEDMKTPADGAPPRPATEPKGSEHSTKGAPTKTDPATGAPNKT